MSARWTESDKVREEGQECKQSACVAAQKDVLLKGELSVERGVLCNIVYSRGLHESQCRST